MKKNRSIITEKTFNDKPILSCKGGMDKTILNKIEEHLDNALEKHSKVFAMRMDIHIPSEKSSNSNQELSKVMAHLIKKEKRAGFDPSYVAVREESQSNEPHNHMLLLLNGNKTQSIATHIKNANEVVNCHLGLPLDERTGYVNDCTKDKRGNPQTNGIMIKRNDPETYNAVFKQGSYLAKLSQKENNPTHQRELFASHSKPH